MLFNVNSLSDLLYLIPAVLIALTFHEFCHGLMAFFLGDKTARDAGRLTLNPLKHIDLFGALMLLLVGFGWAKPVGVNPYRFKNPKVGMALTALAGPLSNIILAFVCILIQDIIAITTSSEIALTIRIFLIHCASINIGLGIFNLIPFPPLDGSRILGLFLPERTYFKLMEYERYLQFVLIILLFTNILNRPLSFITSHVFDFIWNLAAMIVV